MEMIKVINDEQIRTVEILGKKIWNQHYVSIIGQGQVDYMLDKFQSFDVLKSQMENKGYEYYLINNNGIDCGYVGIVKEEERLFLSKLYIEQESRGQGLASKAFAFIENIAKENGLNKIYLTCNKNNCNSIEIYKKKGFVIAREEKADIGNGYYMDDYIMEKELS